MNYTNRHQREVFYLLFLERLLKGTDPRLFVLKGGLNLRLFYLESEAQGRFGGAERWQEICETVFRLLEGD